MVNKPDFLVLEDMLNNGAEVREFWDVKRWRVVKQVLRCGDYRECGRCRGFYEGCTAYNPIKEV